MAGTAKKTKMTPVVVEEPDEDITSLLEGADVAWAQYKRGQGTRITSDDELDAFMDSL